MEAATCRKHLFRPDPSTPPCSWTPELRLLQLFLCDATHGGEIAFSMQADHAALQYFQFVATSLIMMGFESQKQ